MTMSLRCNLDVIKKQVSIKYMYKFAIYVIVLKLAHKTLHSMICLTYSDAHSSTVYIDCKDAYQKGCNTTSGVYTINPDNQTVFQVYCDMDMSTDGGGWTVIHRRLDGSVIFDRNWADCERGFGNKTGEYWLGLSYIHRLTTSASQDLRVDMEYFEGGSAYARYTTFTVSTATDSYRLLVSGYSGTAGDAMSYNSGQQFYYEGS